jgi:hypothetical protein
MECPNCSVENPLGAQRCSCCRHVFSEQSGRLICKVCDRGTLLHKKVFRMSGPVVAIGFILLIPSVIGMGIGLFGFLASAAPNAEQARISQIRDYATSGLRRNGVPETTIKAVLDAVSDGRDQEVRQLTAEMPRADSSWVYDAQEKLRNAGLVGKGKSDFGTALGTAFSIGLLVGSFVGGLLGWLLVMRKRVLQCSLCRAVISAS